ncbi:MAG: sulfotransferase [Rhodanobacteraceae bacterium]|nr:sulfotransferase [Rhodanobacteraceae bacterium]
MPKKSISTPKSATPAVRRLVREAELKLAAHQAAAAEEALICALAMEPDDPQALRTFARVQRLLNRPTDAINALRRALVPTPDDAGLLGELAQALAQAGDLEEAISAQQRVVEHKPEVANWLELGLLLDRNANCAATLDVARRIVKLAPTCHTARLLEARALTGLGRIDEASAVYRQLTSVAGVAAKAWFGLADLKTVKFSSNDIEAMQRLVTSRGSDEEHVLISFALGLACEAHGRFADAMTYFQRGNRMRRKTVTWDAAAHTRYCANIRDAFSTPLEQAPQELGREVVFIVGLPRSGTTLVEQMLAAHPDLVGASELPHLETVIQQESARRGQPFPRWVKSATSADWERLGRRYLQLASQWQTASRFTDKLPENWPYVGAALAMLPGARVIGCERDLIETCWSCYKQLFAPHRVAYSYDFDELAAYAHDCRRLWQWWQLRDPQRCRTLVYEDLLDDPEHQIRALLEFCELPFDPACLTTQQTQRVTRTASAAQVRQPLQRTTARSNAYDTLFAPLRQALERAEAAGRSSATMD